MSREEEDRVSSSSKNRQAKVINLGSNIKKTHPHEALLHPKISILLLEVQREDQVKSLEISGKNNFDESAREKIKK